MSQTRRRGTQILQDEIDSAIALVKTHNTNITRKLEKVKDMVSRYCENKGAASLAPSNSRAAPLALANTSNSLREAAPASLVEASPAPTVLAGALSPIPEGNESNSSPAPVAPLASGAASIPVSLKSKGTGPKPWSNFRTLVGKNTQLKVGQTATSQKIATLWNQAKKGSSTNEIAKYLKNQLQVEPALANQKAPELAKIAVNYAKPTLSKRVTRTVGSNGRVGGAGSAAAAAAASAPRATLKKNKVPLAGAPINPNTETDEEFWARMGKQANANAVKKNANAMQQAETRRQVRAEAALRATPALTPGKNRQVPLASVAEANTNVNRSSPIPTLVRNRTVVNPTTGQEEELSL